MSSFDELTCYQINKSPFRIQPARALRSWMDESDERYAYRCLPLSIANSMGWELVLPQALSATWNGGSDQEDITIKVEGEETESELYASSHFGEGVLTFSVGYLFRTNAGIGLWARGIPNQPKDGIAPLEGIIETDWLDFTFTMNWKFTRPGTVQFAKDEPICFITPVDYHALDNLVPHIVPIASDEEIKLGFQRWRDARLDFNSRLLAEDEQALKEKWQKWYMRGENGPGGESHPRHVSKLRLAAPIRVTDMDLNSKLEE